MIRFIPQFVLDRFAAKELKGGLTGFTLLFDVADFTPITSMFQKQGKQGAEELSAFLDLVFTEPIRIVERFGGFVSLFAGDAFCAIFPDKDGIGILAAVLQIAEFFEDKTNYQCSCGDVNLKIRQTVSYGELFWQIYENELQDEYVFSGEPFQIMAELSALKQDTVFSTTAVNKLGKDKFEPFTENAFVMKAGLDAESCEYQRKPISREPTDHTIYNQFLNPKYRMENPEVEIRAAAFCFASFEGITLDDREYAISIMQTIADKFGGLISRYDATDKGLVALILFGIPRSEDKTLERVCNFSLEALESLPQLALGISCGSVIACYTGSEEVREYTALGSPINLASRLMSKARTGEVLSDAYLWQELHSSYEFSYLGSLTLKGVENSIGYYRLKRLSQAKQREESPFVGRASEIKYIREIVDDCLAGQENAIVYITGDAGIGKSRLASEALSMYGLSATDSQNYCYTYKLTCDVILKKPLEAIKQLVRTHFYYNPMLPKEAGITMFRALWSTISTGDKEMQRIESIIASLLDYEWEGSIWSKQPPEERPKQLKQAFVCFLKALCSSKPVIIHLDDGQWLDEESQSYLQAISEAGIKPIIIISPCRYLENGNKPELMLSKHTRVDLELASLSLSGSSELIKSIMRLNKLPNATNELIQSRSMGNPLFIEQLSSYLLETSSVNDKGEIIKELGYLSTFSISDIIGSRIDRLTQNVKECLYAASVLGMEFEVHTLSEMLKTDLDQELETGQNNLIWRRLNELQYIFSHILIKDIAYQSMFSSKQRELHLLAAEALEEVNKDHLDEKAEDIAFHYEKAGLQLKTAEFSDKAGSWFTKHYDFHKGYLYLNKALQIKEKLLGAEHLDTVSSLISLAGVLYSQCQYSEAESLYLRVLQVQEKILGEEHPDTAQTQIGLANVYVEQVKLSEAESLFLKALQIYEQALGNEYTSKAKTLSGLARLYDIQGRYSESESLYLRALNVYESVLEPENPSVAHTLIDLANLYDNLGRNKEAEPLYLRALQIFENLYGKEHPFVGRALIDMAIMYSNLGKYDQAEPLFLNALDIYEKVRGEEHIITANLLNNLGIMYKNQGRFDQAEPLMLKALKTLELLVGSEHPDTASMFNDLAALYFSQEKYDQAEPLYLKALHIQEEVLGKEHPDTTLTLNNLGVLYINQGKFEEAEMHCSKALQIFSKALGSDNQTTALAWNNLGHLYSRTGRYEEAEKHLLKAFEVWSTNLGTNHYWTLDTIKGLIDLYTKQNQPEKAVYYKAMLPKEDNA